MRGLEDPGFHSCDGLVNVTVCADSGLLATEACAADFRGSPGQDGAGGSGYRTHPELHHAQDGVLLQGREAYCYRQLPGILCNAGGRFGLCT